MSQESLGLERHTVTLKPHDAGWAELFEAERLQLKPVLGNEVDVQHIGSTAVSGLQAKPVLDIGVAVEDFDAAFAFVEPLKTLGYTFRGEQGILRRHYFVKGRDKNRTHHLHMLERTNPEWRRLLFFRDYLRAHPEALEQYQKLKTYLAKRFPNDREAYTRGKNAFIQDILNRAE